jgi:hypothetical protein
MEDCFGSALAKTTIELFSVILACRYSHKSREQGIWSFLS